MSHSEAHVVTSMAEETRLDGVSASGSTASKQVWSMRSSVQNIGDVRESEFDAHDILGKLSATSISMSEGFGVQGFNPPVSEAFHSRYPHARVVDIKQGKESGSPTHSIDTVSTSASPSEESRPLFVPSAGGPTDTVFVPSTSIATAHYGSLAPSSGTSTPTLTGMPTSIGMSAPFAAHGAQSAPYQFSEFSSFFGPMSGEQQYPSATSLVESSAPSVLTMISAKQDEGQTITSSDLGAILPALRVTDVTRTVALARAHAQASILPEGAPKSSLLIEAEARGALAAATMAGMAAEMLARKRYKTKLCHHWVQTGGYCPRGENCDFAHGVRELRMWQEPKNRRFKTKLCKNWLESGGTYCPHADQCHFAHGVHELRVNSEPAGKHFKPRLCAGWLRYGGRFCPNGSNCPHADGIQELQLPSFAQLIRFKENLRRIPAEESTLRAVPSKELLDPEEMMSEAQIPPGAISLELQYCLLIAAGLAGRNVGPSTSLARVVASMGNEAANAALVAAAAAIGIVDLNIFAELSEESGDQTPAEPAPSPQGSESPRLPGASPVQIGRSLSSNPALREIQEAMLGLKGSGQASPVASPISEPRPVGSRPPTGRYGSMLHHSRKLQAQAQAQLVAAGVLRKTGDKTTWDLTKTDLSQLSHEDGASTASDTSSQFSHPLRISQPQGSMSIEPSPIIETASLRERSRQEIPQHHSQAMRGGHPLAYLQRMGALPKSEPAPAPVRMEGGGAGGRRPGPAAQFGPVPDFLRDDWAYYHRDRRGDMPAAARPAPPPAAAPAWPPGAGYFPTEAKPYAPRAPMMQGGGHVPQFMMSHPAPSAGFTPTSAPYPPTSQFDNGNWQLYLYSPHVVLGGSFALCFSGLISFIFTCREQFELS